jgi:hypothetical protein
MSVVAFRGNLERGVAINLFSGYLAHSVVHRLLRGLPERGPKPFTVWPLLIDGRPAVGPTAAAAGAEVELRAAFFDEELGADVHRGGGGRLRPVRRPRDGGRAGVLEAAAARRAADAGVQGGVPLADPIRDASLREAAEAGVRPHPHPAERVQVGPQDGRRGWGCGDPRTRGGSTAGHTRRWGSPTSA